jgi:hypothetical protein
MTCSFPAWDQRAVRAKILAIAWEWDLAGDSLDDRPEAFVIYAGVMVSVAGRARGVAITRYAQSARGSLKKTNSRMI